jgi:hypothetical protein
MEALQEVVGKFEGAIPVNEAYANAQKLKQAQEETEILKKPRQGTW